MNGNSSKRIPGTVHGENKLVTIQTELELLFPNLKERTSTVLGCKLVACEDMNSGMYVWGETTALSVLRVVFLHDVGGGAEPEVD